MSETLAELILFFVRYGQNQGSNSPAVDSKLNELMDELGVDDRDDVMIVLRNYLTSITVSPT